VRRDPAAALSAFAVGYDEGREALVYTLSTGTWSWDGAKWTLIGGGIAAGEARRDAHIVYDRLHGQLVYVGSRYTWTWSGDRWQQHDQPEISAGALGYDPARAVMLVQQDSSACDRTTCRTSTWTWAATAWTRASGDKEAPVFPLTRSGASAAPIAFDEARGLALLFVSAS
jgi:hypothetical protein